MAPLDQESPGSSPEPAPSEARGGATESAASDFPVAALFLFEAVMTTTLPGNVVAAHDAEPVGVYPPPAALERSAWARSSAQRMDFFSSSLSSFAVHWATAHQSRGAPPAPQNKRPFV
jgi:hypothetical protein